MIDKELLALIRGNKRYIGLTVIINIIGMAASLSVTAGVCLALNGAIRREADIGAYVLPIILTAAGIAARFVCGAAAGRFKRVLGERVKMDLREKTYGKILKLNARGADELSMAGLTQVSMEGIEQLDLYYTTYLPQFFYAMAAPFLLFALCVFIDWRTALILLACVPIIPVSIIVVSKKAKKIFAKYWGKYLSMGGAFLDSVQGMRELKIFNADARQNDKMNADAEEFRRITMKVLVMQLFSTTVMDLVAFGGAGLGAALAIFSAVNYSLDPIAALFLILVSAEFFLPLRALGSAFHVAMNGAGAGRKILALLDAEEPAWGGGKLAEAGDIRLSGVTFAYKPGRNVLEDVGMAFPKNRLTAIVGESGSGKSTVAQILTGARRAQTGRATVNGIELSGLSREEYYSRLAVVAYDTYIFNDTVRNNFYLANPKATDAQIWGALKKVNLAGFIESAGGLDKPILEDADNISGGQKQRLALAVSLAAGKSIFIFDEATSNIDVESEAVIMKNIYELRETALVVLISHRLANVAGADNIYVLKDGRVCESGSHDELLTVGKEYANLYLTQKSLECGYKEGGRYA
ncbi:MAG: ABC transporter ATP-binding protein/permease [Clostridiales bacterium]|jgi:ATP-binding cassette subfamily C protein|nr:ABC transporter ATP-binding protein/permease [Clostridiales bacterium]